jgi:hypothetical protein
MLAAIILAAVATAPPLGVWPSTSGPAASTVGDVELYVTEPESEYWILAIQPLPKPLVKADTSELERLAKVAGKLGADAVILLGELPEKEIPESMQDSLPAAGRIGMAVFVTFDCGCDDDSGKGSRHTRAPLTRAKPPGHAAGWRWSSETATPPLPSAMKIKD